MMAKLNKFKNFTILIMVFLLNPNAIPLINSSSAEEGEINIVTSTLMIQDFVSNIAGDLVSLTGILVEGNEDPHTYEPVPSDIQALIEADVFFLMGREGLEPWWSAWEDSIMEDNPDLIVVSIMNETMVEFDNITGENNPHGWMSPVIAKGMVRNIYLELYTLFDAEDQAELTESYNNYKMQLDALLFEIEGNRTKFEGMKVIMHHPAMKYLYDLLGIERKAIIEEQHDVEPSAQHIQEIKELMENEEIGIIVHQTNLDEDEIMQIARDTGAEIVWSAPLLGMEGINQQILSSYVELIRYNLWALDNPTEPTEGSNSTIPGFLPILSIGFSVLSILSLILMYHRKKKVQF